MATAYPGPEPVELGSDDDPVSDGEDWERDDQCYRDTDIGQLDEEYEAEQRSKRPKEEQKLSFYPMQENNARVLLAKIELILKLYSGKKLSDFRDFNFQIYTARYNMLQQQTVQRLMDKAAKCFPDEAYLDKNKTYLRENAEKCVHKYNISKTEIERKEELMKEAESKPDTLFLIIADEAHWGVGKGEEGKDTDNGEGDVELTTTQKGTSRAGAHNQLINCWDCEKYPNVIVLQVTATGFNLKSSTSRLYQDRTYIKMKTEIAKSKGLQEYEIAEENRARNNFSIVLLHHNYVGTSAGSKKSKPLHIHASNVEEKGRLHNMKWSEGHQGMYQQGMTIRLRTPNVKGKPPMWLKKIYERRKFNQVKLSDNVDDCMNLHLSGKSPQHIEIRTEEQDNTTYRLIIYCGQGVIPRSYKLAFVDENSRFFQNDLRRMCDVIDTFTIVNDCGEDVILIKASHDVRLNNDYLKHDIKDSVIILGRRPKDDGLPDLGLSVPDLEFSFLVDFCQSEHVQASKQYLSLNFFYNTMRNEHYNDQLIRGDQKYLDTIKYMMEKEIRPLCSSPGSLPAKTKATKLQKIGTKKKNMIMNNMMAADYAFNILLYSEMENASLCAPSLEDLLQNPDRALGNFSLYAKVNDFCQLLQKQGKMKGISLNTMSQYLSYISQESLCPRPSISHMRRGKLTKTQLQHAREDYLSFFHNLFKCLIYLDMTTIQETFASVFTELQSASDLLKVLSYKYKSYRSRDTSFADWTIVEKILGASETFKIIKSVCGDSKFVVTRVHSQKLGQVFYSTINIARKVACANDFSFEVIRDFNNFMIDDLNYEAENVMSQPKYRIHRRLQPNQCQHIDPQTKHQCKCSDFKPLQPSLQCINCGHKHKEIQSYADLHGLPCILILVNKGRLGDTFPDNFCGLDLRQWFHYPNPLHVTKSYDGSTKAEVYLTRLMQEFGRLCRYSYKPGQKVSSDKEIKYSDLPYVLIGEQLLDNLVYSINRFPVFHGYFTVKRLLDDKLKKTAESTDELIANDNNFDQGNTRKYWNRLLLEAEPQVGKTGVYLYLISLLTKEVNRDNSLDKYELDDEALEGDVFSNDEEDESVEDEGEMPKEYISAEKWLYPYWEDIQTKTAPTPAKTPISNNKYDRIAHSGRKLSSATKPAESKHEGMKKQLAEIIKDKYKAYGPKHSCALCESSASTREPYMTALYIDTIQAEIIISIPYLKKYIPILMGYADQEACKNAMSSNQTNSMPFTQLYNESSQDQATHMEKIRQRALETWIFTASFKRAQSASVNYNHTMVTGDKDNPLKCYYTQFLVVRREEFDLYRDIWGRTHAVIALPDETNFCGQQMTVDSGIGYARLVIQQLARMWKQDHIFMIDDNFVSISEVKTETFEDRKCIVKTRNRVTTGNIPLFKALKHIERMFCHGNLEVEQLKLLMETRDPCPDECLELYDRFALSRYTGHKDNYAAVGCLRERGTRRIVNPFKNSNPYSLFLLNIGILEEKRINFQPLTSREDITLYEECVEKNLSVVKMARFIFVKAQLRSEIVGKVFFWSEHDRIPPMGERKKLLKLAEKGEEQKRLKKYIKHEHAPQYVKIFEREDASKAWIRNEADWAKSFTEVNSGATHMFIQLNSHKTMEDIIEYLRRTPGIGGYKDHCFVLSIEFLVSNSMIGKSQMRDAFCGLFSGGDQEVIFEVFTTHAVNKYRLKYAVILITGTIRQARDSNRDCNVGRAGIKRSHPDGIGKVTRNIFGPVGTMPKKHRESGAGESSFPQEFTPPPSIHGESAEDEDSDEDDVTIIGDPDSEMRDLDQKGEEGIDFLPITPQITQQPDMEISPETLADDEYFPGFGPGARTGAADDIFQDYHGAEGDGGGDPGIRMGRVLSKENFVASGKVSGSGDGIRRQTEDCGSDDSIMEYSVMDDHKDLVPESTDGNNDEASEGVSELATEPLPVPFPTSYATSSTSQASVVTESLRSSEGFNVEDVLEQPSTSTYQREEPSEAEETPGGNSEEPAPQDQSESTPLTLDDYFVYNTRTKKRRPLVANMKLLKTDRVKFNHFSCEGTEWVKRGPSTEKIKEEVDRLLQENNITWRK